MVIIIMGPSGAGKSTVGRALAGDLGWPFVDADDLHEPASIERMRRNIGLTDEDRWPWLRRIRTTLDQMRASGTSVVLACSALRQEYRDYLAAGIDDARIVFLNGTGSLLESRLARRTGHFAAAGLLRSQLATLEPPADAMTVDAALPVGRIVTVIRESLTSERQ
jgi:gluconokinase